MAREVTVEDVDRYCMDVEQVEQDVSSLIDAIVSKDLHKAVGHINAAQGMLQALREAIKVEYEVGATW